MTSMEPAQSTQSDQIKGKIDDSGQCFVESSCMRSFRPDLTGSHQMTSSIKRQKKGACIIRGMLGHDAMSVLTLTRERRGRA